MLNNTKKNHNSSSSANKKDWDICKFLIFVLRHKPQVAKLKLDENGFTDINRIVSYLTKVRKIDITKERLFEVVALSMQKTIEIKGDMIRATSGHSVILSLKIPQDFNVCQSVPKKLYVKVDTDAMFGIIKNGLTSSALRSDMIDNQSDMSLDSRTSLAIIDSGKALKENVCFYQNPAGKYFSSFVPSKFIHFKIK